MEMNRITDICNCTEEQFQIQISFGKSGSRGFFNYEETNAFLYRPYVTGWTYGKSPEEIAGAYRVWR
jgi:hypothetical protein